MIFKNKLPTFVPGKLSSVSQKVFEQYEIKEGFRIVIGGYNYSKVKDFGSFPIRVVNPAVNGKVYENQKTIFPKNANFPSGSVFIGGVHFGANTTIGIGSKLSGVTANGKIVLSDSVSVESSVFNGDVKANSRLTISGNSCFNKSFKSSLNCIVDGLSTTFNDKAVFGDGLKAKNVVFNKPVSIGNDSNIDASFINNELSTGIKTRFTNTVFNTEILFFGKGNTISNKSIFETAAVINGVLIANTMFSKEGVVLNKCKVGTGVKLPNKSIIKSTIFNEFNKSSKSQRSHIGASSEIYGSKINNSEVGSSCYFSNSYVSYCSVSEPNIDKVSVNTFDNVTLVKDEFSEIETMDLSSTVFKGSNVAHVNIFLDVDGDIDVSTLPLPDSEHVTTLRGFDELVVSGFDKMTNSCEGQIVFDGPFVFDVPDINELKEHAWFDCDDECTVCSARELNISNESLEQPESDASLEMVVDSALGVEPNNNVINMAEINSILNDIDNKNSAEGVRTFDTGIYNINLKQDVIPYVQSAVPVETPYDISVEGLNERLKFAAKETIGTIPDEADVLLSHLDVAQ